MNIFPGAIALVHGLYVEADAPLFVRDISCNKRYLVNQDSLSLSCTAASP